MPTDIGLTEVGRAETPPSLRLRPAYRLGIGLGSLLDPSV